MEHTKTIFRTEFIEKLYVIPDDTLSRANMHAALINFNARDVSDFQRASSLYIDTLDLVAARSDIVMDRQVGKDFDVRKLPSSFPADTDAWSPRDSHSHSYNESWLLDDREADERIFVRPNVSSWIEYCPKLYHMSHAGVSRRQNTSG